MAEKLPIVVLSHSAVIRALDNGRVKWEELDDAIFCLGSTAAYVKGGFYDDRYMADYRPELRLIAAGLIPVYVKAEQDERAGTIHGLVVRSEAARWSVLFTLIHKHTGIRLKGSTYRLKTGQVIVKDYCYPAASDVLQSHGFTVIR